MDFLEVSILKVNNDHFTDKLGLNVEHSGGRQLVWRCPGERFDEQNIVQRGRYAGVSIFVWHGIAMNNKN